MRFISGLDIESKQICRPEVLVMWITTSYFTTVCSKTMLFAKKCACSRTSIDDSKEENKKFDRTVIQSLEVLQRSVNNLKVEQELCLSCSCQHCRDSSIVFPEFLVGSVLFIFLVFRYVFFVWFIWLSFFVLCAQCCYWSLDCSLFIAYVFHLLISLTIFMYGTKIN